MAERKIDCEALYSSETGDYRNPQEPNEGDHVFLRFRTAKNGADHVYLLRRNKDDEKLEMERDSSDTYFDYYSCEIELSDEVEYFDYLVTLGEETVRYNRLGVTEETDLCYCFRITPGFSTPDWAKGAVMYQIFVDRFCNGDPKNDVCSREYIYLNMPAEKVENWESETAKLDVCRFYGGDLQGVMEKLDYIYSLGVRVIYFNPLFVSPSNHKYDTQDYDHIDPHYGIIVEDGGELLTENDKTNDRATRYRMRTCSKENLSASDRLFARLVEECHRRGMRVIIDGVFNHCGSFNRWMDRDRFYKNFGGYKKGAFESSDSPYHNYFHFSKQDQWPNNTSYDQWWGNETLPKLNYEGSEELEEDILRIAKKWMSAPFHCDGWRLDVAADLGYSGEYNHKFWKKFRKAVKSVKPNALILAEHYGDPMSWLEGDEWDTIMNYDAFMEPVTWFLTGMEKHSDAKNEELLGNGEAFFGAMTYYMSRMQTSSILCSMNELSNHDHSRFLTRTNGKVGRLSSMGYAAASEGVSKPVFRLATMIQMTWPGAATIYYGDEAGLCGWTDPDSRRPYPWGKEDFELIEYHRYLIGSRRRYPVFRYGSWIRLLADKDLIVFGRMYKQSVAITAINVGNYERDVRIPVWKLGLTDKVVVSRIMKTSIKGYNVGVTYTHARNGYLESHFEAVSGKVYVADCADNEGE